MFVMGLPVNYPDAEPSSAAVLPRLASSGTSQALRQQVVWPLTGWTGAENSGCCFASGTADLLAAMNSVQAAFDDQFRYPATAPAKASKTRTWTSKVRTIPGQSRLLGLWFASEGMDTSHQQGRAV